MNELEKFKTKKIAPLLFIYFLSIGLSATWILNTTIENFLIPMVVFLLVNVLLTFGFMYCVFSNEKKNLSKLNELRVKCGKPIMGEPTFWEWFGKN